MFKALIRKLDVLESNKAAGLRNEKQQGDRD